MAQLSDNHRGSPAALLAELARLYGVELGYRDVWGKWRESPRESLIQVLVALGAELDQADVLAGGKRARRALEEAVEVRQQVLASRLLEPVLVAWDGELLPPALRFSEGGSGPRASKFTLHLEQGGEESKELAGEGAAAEAWRRGAGRVLLWSKLPFGYHRLTVEVRGRAAQAGREVAEALVISAPRKCWGGEESGRSWGLFAGLYELPHLPQAAGLGVERADLGVDDFADLGALCRLVGEAGGEVVATLPLLPFLGKEPLDPSPYRPVSRLFWNELYLALDHTPEWKSCEGLRELWSNPAVQEEARRLRVVERVDYEGAFALKRRLLLEASRCFFAGASPERREAFAGFLEERPEARDYALFRALVEAGEPGRLGGPAGGPCLAESATGGPPGGAGGPATGGTRADHTRAFPKELMNLHLYSQWQCEEQLRAISAQPGAAHLMLDLPVGVHPESYDVWRWPELFARKMSMGAPPDRFFTGGQDWASPPLVPEASRAEGHRYFIACLRHHMRHARYLRLDHVMWLRRLFWIPAGADPAAGVYVRYPEEELYAVVCLESYRNQTRVVGEDLGTVPPGVRARLRRHGILGSWVFQGALCPRACQPLRLPSRHVVAYLGTHDMFPWAGFWQGGDIEARLQTCQLDEKAAKRARAMRKRLATRLAEAVAGPGSVGMESQLFECVRYVGQSRAPLLLLGVDDLLLETEAHNIPGTGAERGNWRRKTRATAGELRTAIEQAGAVLREQGRAGSCSGATGAGQKW